MPRPDAPSAFGEPRPQHPSRVDTGDVDDQEALDAYSSTVMRVAQAVLPSVASVSVQTRQGAGAGSASVITDEGHLLTSAHVVEGASVVELAFHDGSVAAATVVGADPLSDLAVLHAQGDTPPPVRMGDAAGLRVGQLVVALGNPAGSRAASPPASCRLSDARCRPGRGA